MDTLFNRSHQITLRRTLRKQMPPAEAMLWQRLRNRGHCNAKFRRQFGVGPYVLDFYCPGFHLAIELDGDSHESDAVRRSDLERDAFWPLAE